MGENKDGTINTGGGHYVDHVRVNGGDFVIGNTIDLHGDGNILGDGNVSSVTGASTEGVTAKAFLQLLEEIRCLLPEANLDPELVQEAERDLDTAKEQAKKPEPLLPLITAKLEGLATMLVAAGGVAAAGQALAPTAQRLAPLVQKAIEMAGRLF